MPRDAEVPADGEIDEKLGMTEDLSKTASVREIDVTASPRHDDSEEKDDGLRADDTIIITGTDVAFNLLSMRDDHDPAITARSFILGTFLASFEAVVSQIYQFKPTPISISGAFTVLVAYFLGNGWAKLLPRGDVFEARWRARNGQGPLPFWIKVMSIFNHGPWGLKEHAICTLIATSSSHGSIAVGVMAVQDLFYNDLPLTATTIILATLSIGLFGYGLAGLIRPIAVWHVDAVYWGSLPTVKVLQGLHWQSVQYSKPLRWFWYAFGGMFVYEFLPAYMMPWLNSVSVPCLAAMKATGETAAKVTRLFGGSRNNEGLGLFNISFDWQYVNGATAHPLKLQMHVVAGFLVCYAAMLGIYYSNAWESLSQPFMSTQVRTIHGGIYPTSKVFTGGVLNQTAFEQYGPPRLTGSFAYGLLMANAGIGALVMHCILFWGSDIVTAYKRASQGRHDDPHHAYMAKTYKDTPWWWSVIILVVSFVLGLIVVVKENITLPAWAYVLGLLLGLLITPLGTIMFSRYGSPVAVSNLAKMLIGLMLPERPVGNLYFTVWSTNLVYTTLGLCNNFKIGEYLKIPPRVMFLTQVYGTVLGSFISFAVMKAIVNGNRELLVSGDGNSSWSGAPIQAFNTNAVSWAMSKYLFASGALYSAVPWGILLGAGAVVVHKIFHYFIPYIGKFDVAEINMPQFMYLASMIPSYGSQTCVLWTRVIVGFTAQYYLRNHKPRIFKDYMYLVTGAFDGACLTALFILSFAVFGAGGPSKPFPKWWGNNADGNYDFCPRP